jgi:hypothetical protein
MGLDHGGEEIRHRRPRGRDDGGREAGRFPHPQREETRRAFVDQDLNPKSPISRGSENERCGPGTRCQNEIPHSTSSQLIEEDARPELIPIPCGTLTPGAPGEFGSSSHRGYRSPGAAPQALRRA